MVTLEQAAILLKTRPEDVRRLIHDGKIHASKSDNGFLIDIEEIRKKRRVVAANAKSRRRGYRFLRKDSNTQIGKGAVISAGRPILSQRLGRAAIQLAGEETEHGFKESSRVRTPQRLKQYDRFKSAFCGGRINKDAIRDSWAEELQLENGCQSERDAI